MGTNDSARMRAQSSKPSNPGIMTSRIIRSNDPSRTIGNASLACTHTWVSMPAPSSVSATSSAIERSSSAARGESSCDPFGDEPRRPAVRSRNANATPASRGAWKDAGLSRERWIVPWCAPRRRCEKHGGFLSAQPVRAARHLGNHCSGSGGAARENGRGGAKTTQTGVARARDA